MRGVEALCCLEELHVCREILFEDLYLASNDLRKIALTGVANLRTISLWAPNLTGMDLFDCTRLENVCFLNHHELKSRLPADYVMPTLIARLAPSPSAYSEIVAADLRRHSKSRLNVTAETPVDYPFY